MKRLLCITLVLLPPLLMAADEIDEATGLIRNPGWEMVRIHCGGCHSHALVTAQRAAEMQIIDYLSANYPPQPNRRRAPIPPSLLPQSSRDIDREHGTLESPAGAGSYGYSQIQE
jgi:hypothetical protein